MSITEVDPATLDLLTREANKGLMVAFINADLLKRADLDIEDSIVFYDEQMMFEFAVPALPPKPYMDRLYRETPVRYWSRGI